MSRMMVATQRADIRPELLHAEPDLPVMVGRWCQCRGLLIAVGSGP